MFCPLPVLAQAAGVVLTGDIAVSWPVLLVLSLVILAWGEARVHISALREWKREAIVQINALQKGADTQGQQILHIVEMLTEVRSDMKELLHRKDGRSARG